jgi:hypothetical protein
MAGMDRAGTGAVNTSLAVSALVAATVGIIGAVDIRAVVVLAVVTPVAGILTLHVLAAVTPVAGILTLHVLAAGILAVVTLAAVGVAAVGVAADTAASISLR